MDALRSAGISFEVVPGITAAFAAAAALRQPLTDRRCASGVSFSSGHRADGAGSGTTRVIYMPGRDLSAIAAQLRGEGLEPTVPCALVSRASQPDEQIQRTTLGELGNVRPGPAPTLLVVGEALGAESERSVPLSCHTLAATDAEDLGNQA